eukprot:GHVN01009821.1.p1 GENE.GHVN01009821.1~~GHVN01009821.1.p1  ORF type:complete len:172 (+),score=39.92 GHVN01009821.1:77-592(+)
MIIYKDALSDTQDELLTDIYKMEEIDGIVLKVKGQMKTESTKVDDSMFGGNASAEGADADAGGDDSAVSGIDVVLGHRLCQFDMKKKDYMTHIKEYMSKVKERIAKECPDEMDIFVKGSSKFVKDVLSNYKEWDLYCGESMNPDGMLVLCKWDGETPYLYYFKHGLEAEKV